VNVLPKMGICVMYHPFEENAEKAPEIFENSKHLLEKMGGIELIVADKLIDDVTSAIHVGRYFKRAGIDLICVKLATWSSDDLILDISSACDVPFIFWTYPHIHAGSLCGGMQFNATFKELNKECALVYKDDKEALDKISIYAKCVALRNKLKTVKLGRIGNRTQGMSEVIIDELSVREIIGPRIPGFGLDEFKELVKEFTDNDAYRDWEKIKNIAGKVSVSETDGLNAIKNYLALKKLISSNNLDGVTIECYPRYMGKVCLAFSMLADEGIPGACEGDINSLILMYILMNLSGDPVHDIDLLFLFEEDNSILGSHCGCSSFNLAISNRSIELANVRLANKGTCVLFPSKPGKVTMANLIGRKGTYRMGVIEGEAIETGMVFPGNPLRVKLPLPIKDFLNKVERFALGHHWVVAYGNYGKYLKILTSLLEINYIKF